MGKTAKGAIWLSEDHLSVFDFWQFWRNTMDEDVIKFLKIFTELELQEIDKLKNLKGEEINEAKIILANQITELTHGKEKSKEVLSSIKNILSNGTGNKSLPSANIKRQNLIHGIQAYKIFCLDNILCSSNSDARRLITQGAAKINGNKVLDFNYLVTANDIQNNNVIYVSIGKKKHALINII